MKSAYECLGNYGAGQVNGIFNQIWKVKAFPNILTIAWKIFFG